MAITSVIQTPAHHKPWYRHLYVQVLGAIAIGALLGHFYPDLGVQMKPLGDGFIKVIKMLIAPLIFCTVVHGIASMQDMRRVGRVGLKALIYFELVTTLALVIGLIIVNLWQPGVGMNVDPATIDVKQIAAYTTKAGEQSTVEFLLHIIPTSAMGAFVDGEILQVIFFSVLFAAGLFAIGERGRPLVEIIDQTTHVLFGIVGIVMKVAPLGAFGGMAFAIGKYGIGTLASLGELMLGFYVTCLVFVLGVLGTIARLAGFSILKFLRYIKEELLIVLGTSSSETALPRLIAKLENLGADKSVVGLVVPMGYTFNLDGSCIYLTMAAMFLAQATNTDLTLWQQLGILGVLLLTSKGAGGVTGASFVVLAATLTSIGTIPVASIALILGIDRFMSEARALTNVIGNGVATLVIAKWEGALDEARMREHLSHETDAEADEPEKIIA